MHRYIRYNMFLGRYPAPHGVHHYRVWLRIRRDAGTTLWIYETHPWRER